MAPRMREKTVKTVLYALLTVVFLTLTVFYHDGVHKIDTMTECYFQAQGWLLLIGAVLLGSGISFRRHNKADVWFVSLLGMALLVFYVVMLLRYGAMGAIADASAFAAVNAQLIALDIAALASFIRSAICAAGMRDASSAQRITARVVCATVAALLVCLLIMGYGTRFVRYQEITETEYPYTQT